MRANFPAASPENSIVLGGEVFELAPLTAADLRRAQEHLHARRPDILGPAAAAMRHFPPEERAQRWKEALEAARAEVSPEATVEWLQQTIEGAAFAVWLCLEKKHPGRFSREEIMDAMLREFETGKRKFGPAPAAPGQLPGPRHRRRRKRR